VAGPILNIQQIFEHPQFVARETIVEVPDGPAGLVRMQGVIPKFSRTPGQVRFAGQDRGADNEEIYIGELGLTHAELAALRADRVV
jgi:crotonobetainyl-CoA:carnitine CoA-transferase CaiB-like acyl-CoA transferase